MANRRMFSRAVTGSGRFLRLSPTARALYYDLGMEADDDGFVEAFVRLRATGAEEVHLGELERAGLIAVVDPENLVVFIRDWTVNNAVRKDRYTPSIYRSLYPQCVEPEARPEDQLPAPLPEAPVFLEESGENTPGEPLGNQAATTGEPTGVFLSDGLATQVRLGKDRVGKGRLEKDSSVQFIIGQNREVAFYKEGGDFEHARGENACPNPIPENPDEFDFSIENKKKSIDFLMDSKYFKNNSSRASPARL